MSGAAQAREPRYKTKATAWYTPPAETALYGAVPRTAATWQRALTHLQKSLYEYCRQPKFKDVRKSKEVGAPVYASPGYRQAAKDLGVDPKTIYRNAQALVTEKRMMHAFVRMGPQGDRIGTWYVDRPWQEVIDERLADPHIAKAIGKDGRARPLVIGRGRHFMTPEQAGPDGWNIRLDQVPETAELADYERDEDLGPAEYASTDIPADAPAAPEFGVLHQALIDVCSGANEDDVRKIRREAARAYRGQPVPDDDLAWIVHAIGRERHKVAPGQPITPGFLLKSGRLQSKVHVWRQQELTRKAEEARRAARQSSDLIPASEIPELRDDAEPDRKRGAG